MPFIWNRIASFSIFTLFKTYVFGMYLIFLLSFYRGEEKHQFAIWRILCLWIPGSNNNNKFVDIFKKLFLNRVGSKQLNATAKTTPAFLIDPFLIGLHQNAGRGFFWGKNRQPAYWFKLKKNFFDKFSITFPYSAFLHKKH